MNSEKRALVVEGGAMRSIFSTGVLDVFIKNNYYNFDICIGVSAGSTALATYLAGMYGRNSRVTIDYSTRKDFISVRNYLKGGHFMNLDWLWDYCETYDALDIETALNRGIDFYVGVTSVETGKSEYIQPTIENAVPLLMASCAMPIAYRNPVKVDNKLYVDGGIADPIPIEEAIKRGAKEIVVIRSRKKEFIMESKKNQIKNLMLRKYPMVKKAVNQRPNLSWFCGQGLH